MTKKMYYREWVSEETGNYEYDLAASETPESNMTLELQGYNVASVNDLIFAVEACGEVIEGIVEVQEGLYIWREIEFEDFGMKEIDQGYFPIDEQ